MPSRVVNLPGPLVLVPARSLEERLRHLAADHPGMPAHPGQIQADLNARADGVPMRFSEPREIGKDWSFLVYARTYRARLYLSRRGDLYTIGVVDPLRVRDHHRLAEGYLRVRPAQWQLAPDFGAARPGTVVSHAERLRGEWHRLAEDLAAEHGAERVTPAHTDFLDTVDRIIDENERIETEEARAEEPFTYRSIRSTTERRHGRHGVYVFELMSDRRPDEGDFVQIRGERERRGQVTRVRDRWVTVRFDQPVDWERIPQPGELEKTPSTVAFDMQREAVAMVRGRQARNPLLLPVIVDSRVRPIPRAPALPDEELDPDQLVAFRKALTVPDLLLVHGPPGTGKTRTISQIARTCAIDHGERVLVTSHSNRAVDNVLSKLPPDIEAIRVGHEGSVTEEGLPYLLERRVAELRERILTVTRRSMTAYENVEVATQWAGQLDERTGHLAEALAKGRHAARELELARRTAGGPLQIQVDRLVAEAARLIRRLNRNASLSGGLARLRASADRRTTAPLVGPLLVLLVRVLARGMAALRDHGDRLRGEEKRLADECSEAELRLEAVTRDDPAVCRARERTEQAEHLRTERRAEALVVAYALRAVVSGIEPPPPVREPSDAAVTETDLFQLRDWSRLRVPLIVGRKTVLADWHGEVSAADEQLHTELVRYADVIAATSIGAASRSELSGVEFDLAILDEAGQIGVADALVPLVRARRGVLVGDHNQLPPFLDSEVEAWGRSVGDPVLRTLLAKSALEILFPRLPEENIVRLTWQRRMPAAIANFISTAFYESRLRTEVVRDRRDPLFAEPFAFVDTAKLPEARRFERSGRDRERWGQTGYTNPAEADLLVELAVFYQRRGADWAVIVPYRAQLAEIKKSLVSRLGDAELVGLSVGTVDAFQGGERDVILYGFTRSNPYGKVGFLRELRRTNVALSRAKHQLVLVGDLSTLTEAGDRDFRELALALRGHLADQGEICSYEQVAARLSDLNARSEDA